MTTYHEQRRDIMALADALNGRKLELLAAVNEINKGIAALVAESERLFPSAIEEGPISLNDARAVGATINKPKRTCSNCGQQGHTARTCSNIRIEPEPVAPPEKKRRMKPLTEEQKAKRRASLVKARAARRKK